MKKAFLFTTVFLFGTVTLLKANMQDSVLIKHQCKIIEHGYFIFCSFDDKTIIKNTFSYSLDLKKRTYVVKHNGNDTVKTASITKDYIDGFLSSEEYKGNKSFLIFHPEFLKWNNAQKLDFLIQKSNYK